MSLGGFCQTPSPARPQRSRTDRARLSSDQIFQTPKSGFGRVRRALENTTARPASLGSQPLRSWRTASSEMQPIEMDRRSTLSSLKKSSASIKRAAHELGNLS